MITHDVYFDGDSEMALERNIGSSNDTLITQDEYIAGSDASLQNNAIVTVIVIV